MKVIQGLRREHADFERLIKRLEASAGGDEKTARRDARNVLLILLSTLDEHEKVEDVVFGDPSYASGEDAKALIAEAEREHQRIQELRLEFLEAITSYAARHLIAIATLEAS